MRVLVTGAYGFIGSHICEGLLKLGHEVRGCDDLSGGEWANVCHLQQKYGDQFQWFHPTDCGNRVSISGILYNYPCDTLVHCAANAREGASQFQPASVTYRNFYAAMATISAALERKVKRLIIFSSMAIYGNATPPFDEMLPKAPVDIYGLNKAAMEEATYILSTVHDFQYCILRPHNVMGSHQSLYDIHRNVVGIFMNRIMRNEPLFIYGDGEQTRAFSYIEDSLPAFLRAILCDDAYFKDKLHGRAINAGGKIPISVNQLALTVKEAMGVPLDYPTDSIPDRPREVKHAWCTTKLSEELLGYKEEIGWEEGIRRMAKWAKEKGPQEWRNTEELEVINELTPIPWIKAGR